MAKQETEVKIKLRRWEVQTGGDDDPEGLYLMDGGEWHQIIAGMVLWAEDPPQTVDQGADPEAWKQNRVNRPKS